MYELTVTMISSSCTGTDENGYPITERTEKELLIQGRPSSPTRSEFWMASAAGQQLSLVLRVSAWDWDDFPRPKPAELEYMGVNYKIAKVYRVSEDVIELTCTEVA